MSLRSSSVGQTATEYVVLIGVIAVVFALGGPALGGPPLASMLTKAVRTGICKVSFGICTSEEARSAGLKPCTTHTHFDGERVGAKISMS